jgi:tRNA G10  N-methylase Trm11
MKQNPPNPLFKGGTKSRHLYVFTLGREWKVSLAELFSIWWADAYQSHTETIAIFQIVGYSTEQLQRRFLTIWGSIRIIELLGDTTPASFPTDVIEIMRGQKGTGKIDFALGAYGIEYRLSDIWLRIKKTMQDAGSSIRLVNQKNENINAASYKKEKLSKTWQEYNIIEMSGECYIGRTLACQDIDAYAKRDTAKSRDMIIGMMPPKLVQMMINIAQAHPLTTSPSEKGDRSSLSFRRGSGWGGALYDPFCGLGTTLIEAANMGITRVYGSDLSHEMAISTESSLAAYIAEERVWQERILKVGGTPNKDFSDFQSRVWQMDARDVGKTPSPLGEGRGEVYIVSEWYLGEIMRPHEITLDRVKEERRKLGRMYDEFFAGLSRANFCNTIVMTFPFWNMNGTYSYFSEIYDIIEKNGWMIESLLPGEMGLSTRQGTLLYRRESQTVGREVIRIVKK